MDEEALLRCREVFGLRAAKNGTNIQINRCKPEKMDTKEGTDVKTNFLFLTRRGFLPKMRQKKEKEKMKK